MDCVKMMSNVNWMVNIEKFIHKYWKKKYYHKYKKREWDGGLEQKKKQEGEKGGVWGKN